MKIFAIPDRVINQPRQAGVQALRPRVISGGEKLLLPNLSLPSPCATGDGARAASRRLLSEAKCSA